MALNSITVKKLARKRAQMEAENIMKRKVVLPIYYEVHSGIMDLRTGRWIQHDPVDICQTRMAAKEELNWRSKHPRTEGQNAIYIVRRYRHGIELESTETDHKTVEILH